jgi:hypothetical protein
VAETASNSLVFDVPWHLPPHRVILTMPCVWLGGRAGGRRRSRGLQGLCTQRGTQALLTPGHQLATESQQSWAVQHSPPLELSLSSATTLVGQILPTWELLATLGSF